MDGRWIVTFAGDVQGVGFRWRARRLAFRHGLTGFVRNEPDGTVTLDVEGPEPARAAMLGELAAEHGGLDVHHTRVDAPPAGYGEFTIRQD